MDNITCPIFARASRNGDDSYLILPARQLTFREFDSRISSLVKTLLEQGVTEGSGVAILAESDEQYVGLLFALWRIGAVACPLSPRLPATQLVEMIDLAQCAFVWTSSEKLPPRSLKHVRRLKLPQQSGESTANANADTHWYLDRPSTIVFTSGSSGYPKAAVHSLANHYYSALGSNENITLARGDRWLLSLPLYHVGGLAILFRTAIAEAAVVIPPLEYELSDVVEQSQVTHVSMVSTQLYRLLSQPQSIGKLSSLSAVLLGGSAIPRQYAEDAWARGLPVYLSYGLTEMSSQVCTTGGEHEYSSGKTLQHRELEIADDGEILVRGKTLFLGYLEANEIRLAVDSEGWFHTGDIGSLAPNGNLSVVGRKDNMFVSGGENIHPEEIEAALMAIEEVIEAVVVPVKNPEFGFRPVAFVRTDPARKIVADDLKSLPSFKIPIQFYDWPTKYETGGIKLDRRHFHKLVKDMYRHF